MHNFKKPALSAAVAAAALSTQVQAAIGVDANGLPIIDESSTYIVYLSGASAARSFVEELITNPNVPAADAICDTSATTYKYKDSGNGKNQNAYLCVLNKAGNPALAGLSKASRPGSSVTGRPNSALRCSTASPWAFTPPLNWYGMRRDMASR